MRFFCDGLTFSFGRATLSLASFDDDCFAVRALEPLMTDGAFLLNLDHRRRWLAVFSKHITNRRPPCILHFPPLYGILFGEPRRFRSDEANLKPKELNAALVIFVSGDAYTTLPFL